VAIDILSTMQTKSLHIQRTQSVMGKKVVCSSCREVTKADEPYYPATLQADAAQLNGHKRIENSKADNVRRDVFMVRFSQRWRKPTGQVY